MCVCVCVCVRVCVCVEISYTKNISEGAVHVISNLQHLQDQTCPAQLSEAPIERGVPLGGPRPDDRGKGGYIES